MAVHRSPELTDFSLELLCHILQYLPLKTILSISVLCKKLSSAVAMHLRLCKDIDFCEGKIYDYMPASITDDHMHTLFKKCPHLETVYGLHPLKVERRRLRKRSALTVPGIIEALSLCCNLKSIETSDLRLLEAIMQHLPQLDIIGHFQNRDGVFPPHASQRLKLQPYPRISSLHLIGVEVPELTAMPHLEHLHLQCVRFTKLQPFRAFLAQNLKTFVMKHCMGPSLSLRYLSLIIALSSSPSLTRLELVRVPLPGGLFQRAVEDSYRHNGFVNLKTLVISGCKGVLEADLGHLMIVASKNLESIFIQPSLTRDSLFVSLSFAQCEFPKLKNLHLGFVDKLNSAGEWSNDVLLSLGLAEVPDTPSSLTDSGMKVISQLFPNIKSMSVSNCPHLMAMDQWSPIDGEQAWKELTDLTLQRCHCLQLPSFALFLAFLPKIEVVILNDMFREPPKGCSHVGLSAGTGLGMSSAVVSNQDEHIAVQGPQQDFELQPDDHMENDEMDRDFIDIENDENPDQHIMVLQQEFFDEENHIVPAPVVQRENINPEHRIENMEQDVPENRIRRELNEDYDVEYRESEDEDRKSVSSVNSQPSTIDDEIIAVITDEGVKVGGEHFIVGSPRCNPLQGTFWWLKESRRRRNSGDEEEFVDVETMDLDGDEVLALPTHPGGSNPSSSDNDDDVIKGTDSKLCPKRKFRRKKASCAMKKSDDHFMTSDDEIMEPVEKGKRVARSSAKFAVGNPRCNPIQRSFRQLKSRHNSADEKEFVDVETADLDETNALPDEIVTSHDDDDDVMVVGYSETHPKRKVRTSKSSSVVKKPNGYRMVSDDEIVKPIKKGKKVSLNNGDFIIGNPRCNPTEKGSFLWEEESKKRCNCADEKEFVDVETVDLDETNALPRFPVESDTSDDGDVIKVEPHLGKRVRRSKASTVMKTSNDCGIKCHRAVECKNKCSKGFDPNQPSTSRDGNCLFCTCICADADVDLESAQLYRVEQKGSHKRCRNASASNSGAIKKRKSELTSGIKCELESNVKDETNNVEDERFRGPLTRHRKRVLDGDTKVEPSAPSSLYSKSGSAPFCNCQRMDTSELASQSVEIKPEGPSCSRDLGEEPNEDSKSADEEGNESGNYQDFNHSRPVMLSDPVPSPRRDTSTEAFKVKKHKKHKHNRCKKGKKLQRVSRRNRPLTRSQRKRLSRDDYNLVNQGTQATSADIRRSLRRQRNCSRRRGSDHCRNHHRSHGTISTRQLLKRPKQNKPNVVTHNKSTSTSDPLMEDDAVQTLRLVSETLISLTIISCGISDVVIDHCHSMTHVEVQACRILKMFQLHYCPSLKRMSVSQCPKLTLEAIIPEVISLVATRKLLVTFEPCMQMYSPAESEKAIFSKAPLDQGVILFHDFTGSANESVQAAFKEYLLRWMEVVQKLYYTPSFWLAKQKKKKSKTKDAKTRYPYGHCLRRVHGVYTLPSSIAPEGTKWRYQILTNDHVFASALEKVPWDKGFPPPETGEDYNEDDALLSMIETEFNEKNLKMQKKLTAFYIPVSENTS